MDGHQVSTSAHEPAVSVWADPARTLLACRMLDPPPRPGVVARLDRYEVQRVLGAGAMGLVLLARDPQTDQSVAIKLLKPELLGNQHAVHRFLKEARHMQRLEHPRILPVLEVSDREEGPYFVLPYLPQGSLANRIQPGVPLAEATILALARDVAEALAHAHARGITHRDLKPGNVLLDEQGRACLADFGLGRSVHNDSVVDVRQNQTEGTPAYMAPEVALGHAGDTRCDVYSFGAMLHEMLTGQAPYGQGTAAEVLAQLRAGPPRRIDRLNPAAPAGLVKIAQWAMARELRDRYAQMVDVIAELDRVRSGRPPLGPHGGAIRLPSRLLRPRRVAIGLALLIGIAVGVSFLGPRRGHDPPRTPISPFELVREFALPPGASGNSVLLGSLLGGRERDLFLMKNRAMFVFSIQGQCLRAFDLWTPSSQGVSFSMVQDTDDDGKDEMFIGWSDDLTLTLNVLNQNMYPAKRFTTAGSFYDYDGVPCRPNIDAKALVDLNGDSRRELLAAVGAGYGKTPRGIRCFDFDSQQLLWSHEIGPFPTDLRAIDLDGDGKLEVLLGSDAVQNDNRADDGTDDHHCYVHAFSHDGTPRWIRQLDEYYCRVMLETADLDGDGLAELFAWVRGMPQTRGRDGEVGRIVRLGALGEIVAEYDAGVQLESCRALSLDGLPVVIATDRKGFVHKLTPELALIQKTQLVIPRFDSTELRLHACADLDGSGRQWLVFTTSQQQIVENNTTGRLQDNANVQTYYDNAVLVVDPQLRVAGRHVAAEQWKDDCPLSVKVGDLDGDGRNEILSLGTRAAVLRFVPPPAPAPQGAP